MPGGLGSGPQWTSRTIALRRRRPGGDDRPGPAGDAQRALRRSCSTSCWPPSPRRKADAAVRCVVLTSTHEKVFSQRRQPRRLRGRRAAGREALRGRRALPARCSAAIGELGKPTLCAANGHVLAGALGLALACDLIVAQGGRALRDARDQRRRLPVHDHGADLPQRRAQEDERAAAARRADLRRGGRADRDRQQGRARPPSSTPRWPTGRRGSRRKSPRADAAGQGRDVPPAGHGVRRRARRSCRRSSRSRSRPRTSRRACKAFFEKREPVWTGR